MMSVVVDQRVCASGERNFAKALESASDTVEFGERSLDIGVGDLKFSRNRNRGKRVLHIVRTGQIEFDRAAGAASSRITVKHILPAARDDVDRAHLRILRESITDDRLRDERHDLAHARIVDAEHGRSRRTAGDA